MNRYLLPLKREVWEHNGSFIKAPIAIIVILIAALTLAAFTGIKHDPLDLELNYNVFNAEQSDSHDSRQFQFTDTIIDHIDTPATPEINELADKLETNKGMKIAANIPYIAFFLIMGIITLSYALSSLLSDRKDNSILFWKSMPISETQNVLTKMFTALLLLPAIAWVAALVSSVITLLFACAMALWIGIDGLTAYTWSSTPILSSSWNYIGCYLALSLWFLPVLSGLLFVSAAAKKNAFLLAIMPTLVIIVFEAYVFHTHIIIDFITAHTVGIVSLGDNNPVNSLILNPGWSNISTVVSSTGFWISLPISGAFIIATIWLRENRYEGSH